MPCVSPSISPVFIKSNRAGKQNILMFFSLVPANSCQTLEILLLPFYKKALTDVCQRSGEHVSIYMIFLFRSPFCSTKTFSTPASIAKQNQQANSILQHIAEKVWIRHRRRRKNASSMIRQSPMLGSGFPATQPTSNVSPLCLGFVRCPDTGSAGDAKAPVFAVLIPEHATPSCFAREKNQPGQL